MTREEKQLLHKDLCVRLPYGVKMWFPSLIVPIVLDEFVLSVARRRDEEFKPYLRPMSSMTEDEKLDYIALGDIKRYTNPQYAYLIGEQLDYLNAHHFDYRGLIPMGLALEAPPWMYDKEESEEGSEIPIPKTVDEAISTLEKILSDEDREYLLKNGAISMHDSLGRWIRNEWGLWTDSELKNELKKKGFEHPDDMSNYIIEEFIKCLEK